MTMRDALRSARRCIPFKLEPGQGQGLCWSRKPPLEGATACKVNRLAPAASKVGSPSKDWGKIGPQLTVDKYDRSICFTSASSHLQVFAQTEVKGQKGGRRVGRRLSEILGSSKKGRRGTRALGDDQAKTGWENEGENDKYTDYVRRGKTARLKEKRESEERRCLQS